MKWLNQISLRTYILSALGVIALSTFILLLMGRVPWCTCGYIKFWHGIVYSSENSQHLTDWYTFSHIIHGIGFFALLWLVGRRWPIGLRFLLAMVMESSWEIFENTNFIINRYREATISLDYYGDSVINSVTDILACVLGFILARYLPLWVSLLLVIFLELFVGYWIHDNLTLNIIMLIYPFQFIKLWQLRMP